MVEACWAPGVSLSRKDDAPRTLGLDCDNHLTQVGRGAADRMLLGHGRPFYIEGRRTHPRQSPQIAWADRARISQDQANGKPGVNMVQRPA